MVDALESNPSWGLLGPRLVYDDGTLQMSCRRFPPLLLPLLRRPPLDRIFERRRAVRRHLMADFDHLRPDRCSTCSAPASCSALRLRGAPGPFDDRVFLGWDDADWCFRIRDAGGEIVYFPEATVVHSYRRQTRRQPASRAAMRQLVAFLYFQRLYWSRRGTLMGLARGPRPSRGPLSA